MYGVNRVLSHSELLTAKLPVETKDSRHKLISAKRTFIISRRTALSSQSSESLTGVQTPLSGVPSILIQQ